MRKLLTLVTGLVKGPIKMSHDWLVNTCIMSSISSMYYVLISGVKISRDKEGAGDRRKGIRTLNLWCCKWLLSCVVLRWIWRRRDAFTNATYCLSEAESQDLRIVSLVPQAMYIIHFSLLGSKLVVNCNFLIQLRKLTQVNRSSRLACQVDSILHDITCY